MYDDLVKDFELSRDLDLDWDSSVIPCIELAQNRIQEAGIKRQESDVFFSSDDIKIRESLKRVGVKVEYVVTSKEAKRTVVLFLQKHGRRGRYDDLGKLSQRRIIDIIESLVRDNILKTVFTEGSERGFEYSKRQATKSLIRGTSMFGVLEAKQNLGEKLNLLGIEHPGYIKKVLNEGGERDTSFMIRATINNIALSDALKDAPANEVVGMVIGRGHEYDSKKSKLFVDDNPLPFSQVIALQNQANVIVIDTTKE